MSAKKIIVAITGASGTIYSRLLLEKLCQNNNVSEIALILSSSAKNVARYENEQLNHFYVNPKVTLYHNDDLFAAPASGSANYDSMVIIPCSMGTLGRIASGIADNLIARSADVMLKERRKVICVARETPLSGIHLKNMLTVTECGGILLPACPSFYSHPQTMEGICMTVVERVLSHLDIAYMGFSWGNETP